MNERVKNLARIVFVAGVVGTGLYQVKFNIDQQREIDAECGIPNRPNCTRVEENIIMANGVGYNLDQTTIVEFIPKQTLKP